MDEFSNIATLAGSQDEDQVKLKLLKQKYRETDKK